MSFAKTLANIGLAVLPQMFLPPGVAQAASLGGKMLLNGATAGGGGTGAAEQTIQRGPMGASPSAPTAAPFSVPQLPNAPVIPGMGQLGGYGNAPLGLLPQLLSHLQR